MSAEVQVSLIATAVVLFALAALATSLQTECIHGHPFDEDNTYVTAAGKRACRACNRAAQQRYADRKRAT